MNWDKWADEYDPRYDDEQHPCPRCGKLTVGTYNEGIWHRECNECWEEVR